VRPTTAGTSYTATAWVRSDVPGKRTCLYIREFTGAGSVIAQTSTCLTATTAWQQFPAVAYTTAQSGGSLEVYAVQTGAVAGDSFELDGVTLSTGTAPAADTTPPDTSITSGPSGTVSETSASFSFTASETATFQCQLDGGAWTTCTSPAAYSGLAAASHTFSVRATDTAGNVDATPATRTWTIAAPPPAGTNLFANGSFESGLTGWAGWQSTLSLASDGEDGSQAAKVSQATGTSFSIYPSSRPVRPTTAGTSYTATAWVRSDVPGKRTCLYIREFTGAGSVLAQTSTCLTAGTAWQQFPAVAYTTAQSGGSLEVYAVQTGAVAGDSFELDAVTLTQG
jgi:hypothetical protein